MNQRKTKTSSKSKDIESRGNSKGPIWKSDSCSPMPKTNKKNEEKGEERLPMRFSRLLSKVRKERVGSIRPCRIPARNLAALLDEILNQRFYYETGDKKLDILMKRKPGSTPDSLENFSDFVFEFLLKKFKNQSQAENVKKHFFPLTWLVSVEA